MQYQDCLTEAQADEDAAGVFPEGDPMSLAGANINPHTGLATDYLNHFAEAVMLLEMVGTCPDSLSDIRTWKPISYRQHFHESRLKGRELAIAAYASADPAARASLDHLTDKMTSVIEATRASMTADLPHQVAGDLAARAARWLKPLVARAGAVINGEIDSTASETIDIRAPQDAADRLMRA